MMPGSVSVCPTTSTTSLACCRRWRSTNSFASPLAGKEVTVLAKGDDDRRKAIAKLLPYQQQDFEGIFRALDGLPACIRFLDPPLHEFLPHDSTQQHTVAEQLGVPTEEVARRVHELHEFNPMLGFRGCRLGIEYPVISEMQARAIFQAAAAVQKRGIKVHPEVMIPLVGDLTELKVQAEVPPHFRRTIEAFGFSTTGDRESE